MLKLVKAISCCMLFGTSVHAEGNDWPAPAILQDNKVLDASRNHFGGGPGVGVGVYVMENATRPDDILEAIEAADRESLFKYVGMFDGVAVAYGFPFTVVFSNDAEALATVGWVDSIVRRDEFTVGTSKVGFEVIKTEKHPATPTQVVFVHYSSQQGWSSVPTKCLARQVVAILYTDGDGSEYDTQGCIENDLQ